MSTIQIAEIAGGAILLGCASGAASATAVYLRLVARLKRRRETDRTALELEKRRETYLSGRDTVVRENAGPPAEITNLFPISKVGELTKRKRDENR